MPYSSPGKRAAYWPFIPKPEANCSQQERPGKSVGFKICQPARWVTGNQVTVFPPSCSMPGVARWNFQRLVDLKQCDVVQICHAQQFSCSHSSLLLW